MRKIIRKTTALGRIIRTRLFGATALAVACAIVIAVVAFNTNTIVVKDADKVHKISTLQTEPKKILDKSGITLSLDDEIIFSGLRNGQGTIEIRRAFDVVIEADGVTTSIPATGGTVAEALQKAEITLGEDDILNCELTDEVSRGMRVRVSRVTFAREEKSEALPFATETRVNAKLQKGKTRTVQEGAAGQKLYVYENKYINGELAGSTLLQESVTAQPVNRVVEVGTYVAPKPSIKAARVGSGSTISPLRPSQPIELDANGHPVNYTAVFSGPGTAYTARDGAGVAGAWRVNLPYGKKAQVGYVAVDPNKIPYGSRLYIVSADGKFNYGYAIAADTGGFVSNGSGILTDLYFNTMDECRSFGRRNVIVYVLP